jgi:hypothetical protein
MLCNGKKNVNRAVRSANEEKAVYIKKSKGIPIVTQSDKITFASLLHCLLP